eukprot:15462750-Alexandrium_andersonii.AAC.1
MASTHAAPPMSSSTSSEARTWKSDPRKASMKPSSRRWTRSEQQHLFAVAFSLRGAAPGAFQSRGPTTSNWQCGGRPMCA